ncbi:hypothetical protein JVT61DRAFT_1188 [Boletus reticuloceps]|uniref:Uncharacterized protein n=1 Tax=Boletus reticuloceps TaxID=495285 RepID=A0A8I3AC42_9AGAM|nr:hypothetical protein JVT61DRAFT_1188 [Boletus reticuloceps]
MATTHFDRIYHDLQKLRVCTIIHEHLFVDSWPLLELRLAGSGMAWKGEENEAVSAIPADEIKLAQRLRY